MSTFDKKLKKMLCDSFVINGTDLGTGYAVVTPFKYEDGDNVVVFLSEVDGAIRVDDNGEAMFRLCQHNLSPDTPKTVAWLKNINSRFKIDYCKESDELYAISKTDSELASLIFSVAECSSQVQVFSDIKADRNLTGFKDAVLKVLQEISQESNIPMELNTVIDQGNQFTVDALMELKNQRLAFVLAGTNERLQEAELMYTAPFLNGHKPNDYPKIYAIIEKQDKFSKKQLARAGYLTDKLLTFDGMQIPLKNHITHLTLQ